MKKIHGFTKPIKKKLDNIERLYNYYSELCKHNVWLQFDNKFVIGGDGENYFVKLTVVKKGLIEMEFDLYFSEIYINANNYFDIYRDISKQVEYVEDRIW